MMLSVSSYHQTLSYGFGLPKWPIFGSWWQTAWRACCLLQGTSFFPPPLFDKNDKKNTTDKLSSLFVGFTARTQIFWKIFFFFSLPVFSRCFLVIKTLCLVLFLTPLGNFGFPLFSSQNFRSLPFPLQKFREVFLSTQNFRDLPFLRIEISGVPLFSHRNFREIYHLSLTEISDVPFFSYRIFCIHPLPY